jgi:hypothetical protein
MNLKVSPPRLDSFQDFRRIPQRIKLMDRRSAASGGAIVNGMDIA